MKILVIGAGGREHTLLWKLSQSPLVSRLYCAPGNGGTAKIAKTVPVKEHEIEALAEYAEKEKIDLTVVGPEAPLVLGVADVFRKRGLMLFGPSQKASVLEGSKIFAKNLMQKYRIPTAEFAACSTVDEAMGSLDRFGFPVVIKADGLAAGKGVIIAKTRLEAEKAVQQIMVEKAFGDAGEEVLIEECLKGEEVSVLAFTDGKDVIPMVSSQDHKRIFDGDQGPNTGGMGAYSPAPVYTPEIAKEVEKDILTPTVEAMAKEGIPYEGVLYAGLMITEEGPKVLEYNARFGDPETQVILPRLKTDLAELMLKVCGHGLKGLSLEWTDMACVCVVLASGGYPRRYETQKRIQGLAEVELMEEVHIFHAGTKEFEGDLVTAGGRVLGVTALGGTITEAIDKAYAAVGKIHFKEMMYRSDIGHRALEKRKE